MRPRRGRTGLRWLVGLLGVLPWAAGAGLRVEVNLPAYTLRLYDGDRVVMERPVTIGEPAHPTPRGRWTMDRLVWNPDWVPPPSAERSATEPVPPGPANPMGAVKLPLAAPYYIHGTRRRAQLGQAASLGCVRLANGAARELARELQRRLLPAERVARIRRARAEHPDRPLTVRLPEGVPVHVRYRPLAVDGRSAVLYPDVYGQWGEPRRVLQRALARRLGVPKGELSLQQSPLLERLDSGWAHPLRFDLEVDGVEASRNSLSRR
jgi:murein L,D-transpeptidase YcbB/YkuD